MHIIFRIIIFIALLLVALLYLNSSFYSAWVSGGPPNDYPEAWAFRSFMHFFYCIGFLFSAITFFLVSKPNRTRMKLKLFIGLALTLIMFLTPSIKKNIEIDSCLDNGGKWNGKYHKCEK